MIKDFPNDTPPSCFQYRGGNVYIISFNPCSNRTRQVEGHSHLIAKETKALKSAQGHLANKSLRGPYKVRFPKQIYHTTQLKP